MKKLFIICSSIWLLFSATKEAKNTPEGMIYIKEGYTQIGSQLEFAQETPISRRKIDAFYMDVHPVTVKQFRAFVQATNYVTEAEKFGNAGVLDYATGKWDLKDGANWEYPRGREGGKAIDSHPVTQVSWNDANAYCKWAGKRLPTEFEWEHAARNAGKITKDIYPWGSNNILDEGEYRANVWQGRFPVQNTQEDGFLYTSPVGEFGKSPIGLQDIVGNVWEWCSNWKVAYDANEFTLNEESEKVQRGGSYLCEAKVCHGYRVSARSGSTPSTSLMHVGFRCVRDI